MSKRSDYPEGYLIARAVVVTLVVMIGLFWWGVVLLMAAKLG